MKYDLESGNWYLYNDTSGWEQIDRLDALRIIEENGNIHWDGELCSFGFTVLQTLDVQ